MIKPLLTKGLALGLSKTAKSLYWVFSGNFASIILTFFTTILIARQLTKEANGIFLALFSFANLLSDLGDAGLGGAMSSFLPKLLREQEHKSVITHVATAFRIEFFIALTVFLGISIFSGPLSVYLFAQTAGVLVILVAFNAFMLILLGFSIFTLGAYQKFYAVSLTNIFYSLIRLVLLIALLPFGKLTIFSILSTYLAASIISWIFSFKYLSPRVLFAQPDRKLVKKLVGFSSVLALQKVFIAVASRLDLLMLVPLSGAFDAGVYGIASRFAMVYPVIIGSLGQVMAPKFAEFAKGKHALEFFGKISIVVGLLLFSEVLFYIFAQPLILFLVPKYADAIPVFQGLLVAMIGFIVATPFVTFLIYTLKKPHITTIASATQLLIIFIANAYFMPQYGRFAPAIGIGLGNVALCIITISATVYYLKKEV